MTIYNKFDFVMESTLMVTPTFNRRGFTTNITLFAYVWFQPDYEQQVERQLRVRGFKKNVQVYSRVT